MSKIPLIAGELMLFLGLWIALWDISRSVTLPGQESYFGDLYAVQRQGC